MVGRALRNSVSFGLALALWLACAVATGQAARTPIHVAYAAPGGCPVAESFKQDLFSRASQAREATPSETARIFVQVSINRSADAVRGVLALRRGASPASYREVTADTCEALVSALTLVAAVAIGVEIQHERSPSVSASTVAEPARPTRSTATSDQAARPAKSAEPPPRPTTAAPTVVRKPKAPRPTALQVFLSGLGGGTLGVSKELMPTAKLGSRYALRSGAARRALDFSLTYGWQTEDLIGIGPIDYRLLTLNLELCPYVFASDDGFFAPFGGLEVGWLRVGPKPSPALSETSPEAVFWLAPEAGIGLIAPLTARLAAILKVSVLFEVHGYSFVLEGPPEDPDGRAQVRDLPNIAGNASFGLAFDVFSDRFGRPR